MGVAHMRNSPQAATAALAVLAIALAFNGPGPAKADQIIIPQPIPPQFNFPLPAATINSWISSSDTQAIRGHAWTLWAGLTATSDQILNGQNLPVWETWYGSE